MLFADIYDIGYHCHKNCYHGGVDGENMTNLHLNIINFLLVFCTADMYILLSAIL